MTKYDFGIIFFGVNTNITFLPIFNQSAPGVWDDFLRIQAAAMRHVYNYKMDNTDFEAAKLSLKNDWRHYTYNFAFGANDNDSMIGFIQGNCIRGITTIQGLYVMPQYMSQHVGARLLRRAEQYASMVSKSIELVSLLRAQGFYEHHGYTQSGPGNNSYTKRISRTPHCETVPVFRPTPQIVRACQKIAAGNGYAFDANAISGEHNPMFVYFDVNSAVCGFSVADHNGDIRVCIAPHQPTDFIHNRLTREMKMIVRSKTR